MNGIVFPVSVVEKTFEPIESNYGLNKHNLRYKIKKLYPVDYNLITYRLPYLPQGPINTSGNQPVIPTPPLTQDMTGRPEDTIYDPDSWEPDLRFYSTFPNGMIDWSYASVYKAMPERHIVHRGSLMPSGVRDNYGGIMRALMFWNFLLVHVRDWWARGAERWGSPFIVIKGNVNDSNTLDLYQTALQLSTKLFGIRLANSRASRTMNSISLRVRCFSPIS